jgi:phage terminase large subunit
MQMTRGWIEEVGEVNELAKINLKLSIGRWKNDDYKLLGKLLMTCNPKKNWLKYNYIDPLKKGLLPKEIAVVLASVYDNKHRQSGSERVLEGLTGTARQRLLLGDWEYDSDEDCLILGEKIVDLYSNDFIKDGEKFITCDVARFGKDKSVIAVWSGWKVVYLEILIHKKTTEVAASIKLLRKKYSVGLSNIICDEDGVGGGVVDELGCKGFVNNSTPLPNPKDEKKENYDSLKSQCYYMLATRINEAGMYVECDLANTFYSGKSIKELLNQELENVRKKDVDSDKKLGVMPKEKVKELIGRSPDFSDTLMMREWFELEEKEFEPQPEIGQYFH